MGGWQDVSYVRSACKLEHPVETWTRILQIAPTISLFVKEVTNKLEAQLMHHADTCNPEV
jgi:hypothetical protein